VLLLLLLLLPELAAQATFEKTLQAVLAQSSSERMQERRAVRGLAAACKPEFIHLHIMLPLLMPLPCSPVPFCCCSFASQL
jgi:hypothetical protein